MYRYKRIKINKKTVQEHRFVVEQATGKKLTPDMVVHHKNGNKLDNRLENLEIMPLSEHTRLHATGRKDTVEIVEQKRARGLQNAKRFTEEYGKKVCCKEKNGKIVKIYPSARSTKKDGFIGTHVSDVCNKKRKSHGGFLWEYI